MNYYFIGIGGIGMSALARYFRGRGCAVGGYDRVRTPLTEALEGEGAAVHYSDAVELIPAEFRDPATAIVIYTPAVPAEMGELAWFRAEGFKVVKRSEILEEITGGAYLMAIAGTHGKTTTTTMTAWFNDVLTGGGSAFLGGISKNFESNLVVGSGSRLVVEADEYDRSFLRLHPDSAVITATDADHLDIYGSHAELRRAFVEFVSQIRSGGAVIIRSGVEVEINNPDITVYRYSTVDSKADFMATNIAVGADGYPIFDMVFPDAVVSGCRLGVLGAVNVENAVAAAALCWVAAQREGRQVDGDLMRRATNSFTGVRRRFDLHLNTPVRLYMDDYAHHPEELRAAITSLREVFPGRKLTIAFQPHLYTRTRDFAEGFSAALSLADEVILLPIYPAREEPVEGVSSAMLAEKITVPVVVLRDKSELPDELKQRQVDMFVTFGAGDIDTLCDKVKTVLNS